MLVSGNHYELTPSGILVHPQEQTSKPQPFLFSFVDVLSLSDKGQVLSYEESDALGTLVERWIREHLTRHEGSSLGRSEINAAFAYANQRLLQSDATGLNQVAVSVIVALLSPDGKELLVGGVGDSRLFAFREEQKELLLSDPLNEQVEPGFSPEERLFALQNAIGIREHLLVHTNSVPIQGKTHLLASSYGLLSEVDEQTLASTLDSYEAENDLFPELLKKITPNGHLIHLKSLTAKTLLTKQTPTLEKPSDKPPSSVDTDRKKQRLTAFGLSAATCALILGVTASMLESPSHSDTAPSPKPIVQQINNETEGKLKTLQGADRDNKALISQLKEELFASEQQIAALEKLLSTQDKTPSFSEETLKEKLTTATRRIAYLEQTVDTLENVAQSADDSMEHQLQVAIADQEILRTALKERDEKVVELEEALSSLSLEKQALVDQPLEEEIARESEFLEQLTQQEAVIAQLRQQLATADRSAEERRDRVTELMNSRDILQQKHDVLQEQLTALRNEQVVAESLKQKVSELTQACTQRDEVVRKMSDTLQRQDKIITQLRESRLALLRQNHYPTTQQPSSAQPVQTLQPVQKSETTARLHNVKNGDTLSQLALQYYGSAQRWRDIYEANRNIIADVNAINVGTTLTIP